LDIGLLYAAFGGLWEPVWVWFLNRSSLEKGSRKYAYLALFLVTSVISVFFVGKAMETMNVGVAYAIWTAVGSVTTLLISRFVLKERFNLVKVVAVFLILTGIVGLEMFGGSS